MINARLITIKTLRPTNTRGTRVSIKSDGHGIQLPYDYRYNSSVNQAYDHLSELGIDICLISRNDKGETVFITEDMHTPIKHIK